MKTACVVIAGFLLGLSSFGESALDQEITLVGRDQAALSPLPPVSFASADFPELDLRRPPSAVLAPVAPPAGDWLGSAESGLSVNALELFQSAHSNVERLARARVWNGALSWWI